MERYPAYAVAQSPVQNELAKRKETLPQESSWRQERTKMKTTALSAALTLQHKLVCPSARARHRNDFGGIEARASGYDRMETTG